MSNHMSFDERVMIQEGLDLGKSLAEIGRQLGRSRSTISREVQGRKIIIPAKGNVCVNRKACNLPAGCKTRNCDFPSNCQSGCRVCRIGCPDFEEEYCPERQKFRDPMKIEVDQQTGEQQCRLFYCDPRNSNQKSRCERNHEFIRYVIPKGSSMDGLTQKDITKMMNHINSYPRKKWKGRSPIDLFRQIYGQETATLLGLEKIDPDSIFLRPELLKK